MHEMSIVEALLEAVEREVRAYGDARVVSIRVRIGALRLVVPETLRFCYEASVRDTPLAGAQLEIEKLPATARCRECRWEFAVEENWFECPRCQSAGAELLTGQELDLISIELEELQEVEAAK
ncbi:MAG: hydrogenase maturation nickel metallochaperone HypA [Verrucomicrobiia bacterium]